jgi:transposase
VATLNVIRRWALREQMSIREISKRTGLARNAVKKYLSSEKMEPSYPRRVSVEFRRNLTHVEPKFPSKVDPRRTYPASF